MRLVGRHGRTVTAARAGNRGAHLASRGPVRQSRRAASKALGLGGQPGQLLGRQTRSAGRRVLLQLLQRSGARDRGQCSGAR